MDFYIYVIQSEKDGSYYKGFSEDFIKRLEFHNRGASKYTSRKTPWKLVYIEKVDTKRNALIREKNLKKATKERIEALIQSPKNIFKNK